MKLLLFLLMAAATGSTAVRAQNTPVHRFEVASVRQNTSTEPLVFRNEPGGRLVATNNTLYNLIRNAWNLQPFQMIEGERVPSTLRRDRWDITAKAPDGPLAPGAVMAMLQQLLIDRFKLVVRRETREMPIYALVLARADKRLGPKIQPSNGECEAARLAALSGVGQPTPPQVPRGFCGSRTSASNGIGTYSASGLALSEFIRTIAGQTSRFIVDRTGLTGTFDFDVSFTPGKPGAPAGDNPGLSLFVALEEQLGLKLEDTRGPVEVIVIESFERPTDD